uniref:Uncharacterized protein n=1 Tax=Haptolina brevifila TaxID=156173 RepID=A0A7S2NG51_9EUKA
MNQNSGWYTDLHMVLPRDAAYQVLHQMAREYFECNGPFCYRDSESWLFSTVYATAKATNASLRHVAFPFTIVRNSSFEPQTHALGCERAADLAACMKAAYPTEHRFDVQSVSQLLPHAGFCSATEEGGGDCEAGDKGSWRLAHHEQLDWTSAATVCFARCAACRRCRYISVSTTWGDCSWFHQCALHQLQTSVSGFRSAQAHSHKGEG